MLLHHIVWYCMVPSCIDCIVILSDWCDIGVVQSENLKKLPAEVEKRADTADISVLFFLGCANLLAVHAQTKCAVLPCAISTVQLALCY